jgi:uncharacterized protein (DUF2336 family)
MLVRHYLSWVQTAPRDARAASTASLARAYVGADMTEGERAEAAAALTLALDDPDPAVRRAMAEAVAGSSRAPRHVVFALARDAGDIAAIVVEHSPLPGDGDLVDWVATGSGTVQAAVARRHGLSAPVAAAIAEVAEADAVTALLRNPTAAIPAFSLTRIVERLGADPAIAGALLERPDLPVLVSYELTAARLGAGGGPGGVRAALDAHERAAVEIAGGVGTDEALVLAAHLRQSGRLTVSLLLRALICGRPGLFHAALSELSGLPVPRVAGIAAERRGGGFEALCRKMGLSDGAVHVLRAALQALRQAEHAHDPWQAPPCEATQARRVLAQVLARGVAEGWHESDATAVSLRRLDDELAREEALALAGDLLRPDGEAQAVLILQPAMALPATDAEAGAPLQERPAPTLPEILVEAASVVTLPPPGPAADPAEIVAQEHLAAAAEHDVVFEQLPAAGVPSFGTVAAMLEDAVAAALSNLPPPPPRRPDWREIARQALVIDGEWVGVAVDGSFDPAQFTSKAA